MSFCEHADPPRVLVRKLPSDLHNANRANDANVANDANEANGVTWRDFWG